MIYDLETAPAGLSYRLLASTVTPRPIGWITSVSAKGVVNAAPFSFFNVMGGNPPTIAVGFLEGPAGWKDTPRNIREVGEFNLHLVSCALAEKMNLTSANMPPDVSEINVAGLATGLASKVRPPIIAAAPVALECVCHSFVETGPYQGIAIGLVVAIHIDDDYLTDPERGHVDTLRLDLVSRLHGRGWYGSQPKLFEMLRPAWPPEDEATE